MIHLAREAGAQEDHTVWGSHLAPDTPQLVLAVRRHGSREQAWSLRLLGRAVARRLPDLRVSLACVGRDAPALTEVMASATSESVVVPLWLSSTERTQRALARPPRSAGTRCRSPGRSDRTRSWPTSWRGGCARPVPRSATPWSWRRPRRPSPTATSTWCVPQPCCGPAGTAHRSRSPTPPGRARTIDGAVRALRQTGAPRVAVAPWTLMPGTDAASVTMQARQAGVSVIAEPPGMHPLVLGLVVRRYLAAVESRRGRVVAA